MLQTILDAFSSSTPKPLSAEDCRLALATLLVRVARADDQYDHSEQDMILKVLKDRYDLPTDAAQSLMTEAEELETKSPDTVRFTKVIKDNVPYEDRSSVVESLWRVALADGSRDFEEEGFLRLVVNLLGVNDRDSGFARQKVIAQMNEG